MREYFGSCGSGLDNEEFAYAVVTKWSTASGRWYVRSSSYRAGKIGSKPSKIANRNARLSKNMLCAEPLRKLTNEFASSGRVASLINRTSNIVWSKRHEPF